MDEETLFESESIQTREEIAAYLKKVAENLETGENITLKSNHQSITMSPPSSLVFEVKAEREGPKDDPGELSIEFELEWEENGNNNNRLSIE